MAVYCLQTYYRILKLRYSSWYLLMGSVLTHVQHVIHNNFLIVHLTNKHGFCSHIHLNSVSKHLWCVALSKMDYIGSIICSLYVNIVTVTASEHCEFV